MTLRFSFRQPRRGLSFIGLLLVIGLLTICGGGLWYYLNQGAVDKTQNLNTVQVTRGPFDHIVLEQGEIESSSNIDVQSMVKSKAGGAISIIWVIPEATQVKKGDKLVELDSAALEDQAKQQRVVVNAAQAKVISSDAALKQAEIAKEEYLEGVYITNEKTILSKIAVAEQDTRKAQLAAESTERLVAKGLVKSLQLEADRFAVANARNQLEGAQAELRVLQELTKKKMLVEYDSKIEAARAQLEADRNSLLEEESELKEIQSQIELCVITAPADGVVNYANQYSSRGGNAEFVVEPGAAVRERQTIIRLPDPSKMQVKATINESRITLVREGMAARIVVDAIPGLELLGQVTKVNRYAEPGSWFSSSIKEYAAFVRIIDPPPSIRVGLTSNVRIYVEQMKDAIQVPIQGVYEHRGEMYSLVKDGRDFETRKVEVPATNEKFAVIANGLKEGETVVLDLARHLDLMDLPDVSGVEAEKSGSLAEMVTSKTGSEVTSGAPQTVLASPAAGAPSAGAPAAGAPAGAVAGGPAGGGPPGGGGGFGGPGGPGANMSPAQRIDSMFQRLDTNTDGKLSKDETSSMGQFGEMLMQADANSDGFVDKTEVTTAMAKMRRGGPGGGGGPPGGGGGFGGGGGGQ